jgi:hypothetical protein
MELVVEPQRVFTGEAEPQRVGGGAAKGSPSPFTALPPVQGPAREAEEGRNGARGGGAEGEWIRRRGGGKERKRKEEENKENKEEEK